VIAFIYLAFGNGWEGFICHKKLEHPKKKTTIKEIAKSIVE
jgi:hypothetical protein